MQGTAEGIKLKFQGLSRGILFTKQKLVFLQKKIFFLRIIHIFLSEVPEIIGWHAGFTIACPLRHGFESWCRLLFSLR
jgi:hypothetical protein